MGISIYYDAVREYKLTDEENSIIETIIEKYNSKKDKKSEDFCVYDYDPEDPKIIFNGSTGLPMNNPMRTVKSCIFWAECLTEIRKVVKNTTWCVQLDDTELKWDEKEGWQLPIE